MLSNTTKYFLTPPKNKKKCFCSLCITYPIIGLVACGFSWLLDHLNDMLFWVTFTALGVPGGAGYVLGSAERCNIDELLFSTWRDVKVHAFSIFVVVVLVSKRKVSRTWKENEWKEENNNNDCLRKKYMQIVFFFV